MQEVKYHCGSLLIKILSESGENSLLKPLYQPVNLASCSGCEEHRSEPVRMKYKGKKNFYEVYGE